MPLRVRLLLFLLLLFSLRGGLYAQTSTLPIGQWQLHVPNQLAKAVAIAEDKVYCATEYGFFVYDKAFNQLKTLSKSDGFSEVQVAALGYEPQSRTLLVAYENAIIDLMQDGEITSIRAIQQRFIPGEKQIYQVYFQGKTAYLSTSFGVVVLDLVKQEIKETYSNLGPNGQPLKIYASTILNDSIYLATANGIMAARRSNTNLLDFRNWRTFTPAQGLPPANTQDFKAIAAFNNKIYAGINQTGLYRYNGISWSVVPGTAGRAFNQLVAYPAYLLITTDQNLQMLSTTNTLTIKDDPLLNNPRSAVPDVDNIFWVADYWNGLVKLSGSGAENYVPNAPMYNSAFRVYSDNKKVYVLGGGYDQNYTPQNSQTGFYELENGRWTSFNRQTLPSQFPDVPDLVAAVRNPVNQKLYIASYGGGLVEWEGPDKSKIYHAGNSPLVSANGKTYLAGVAADAEGNIWVTNRSQVANAPGLHKLRPNGTWQSYTINGFTEAANLEQIILDDYGQKWMIVSRNGSSSRGLLVYDEVKNQFRHITSSLGQGALPGSEVYDLVSDKNSQLWVGTDKGVAVFYEPGRVFSNPDFAAVTPIISRRPLLENQVVTALAVDGGNRKWVGTNTGLWLFSEDGDAVVAQFTVENSPLPSNNIIDIAINQSTGEVFIATAAGLISYRGTATETTGKPDCATVFPNPVRPGYNGLVGIANLPNSAIVKITDITGALVYQTKAQGGTVAWDLRDLNGKRVKSGVYLAYSANADGSQSCISKIAVVE